MKNVNYLKIVLWVLCGFILISYSSCLKNNEGELVKNDTIKILVTCDTIEPTYTKINSIFAENCVICHNNQVFNANIKLNTFENAKLAATSGLLKKAVNHIIGVTPMPFQRQKLNNCDIRKITIWIERNSPQ